MLEEVELDPDWQVVPVAAGSLFECVRWLSSRRQFQWVDIFNAQILRWDPYESRPVQIHDIPLEFVTSALPLDERRQLVCSRDLIAIYDWDTGDLAPLISCKFDSDIRFNDGGISPAGRAYVGTMSMAGRTDAANLYVVDGDDLRVALSGIGISNGIVWEDVASGIWVDSAARSVNRLQFAADGTVSDSDVLYRFSGADEPDGLSMTPGGALLIAVWRGSRLVKLSTDGVVRSTIRVPATYPTSALYGGEREELLFVTTADHVEDGYSRGAHGGHALMSSAPQLLEGTRS